MLEPEKDWFRKRLRHEYVFGCLTWYYTERNNVYVMWM